MENFSPSTYVEKHDLNDQSKDYVKFGVGKNVVLNVDQQDTAIVNVGGKVRERDSARANSTMLTEYKWENKATYTGRLLAARGKLVAYRLFNENTGEAIRVMERETRARHLIKDFRHPTVDLQWATHAPLLAVLDANANLYVYHVDEKCNTLSKYLNIIRNDSKAGSQSPVTNASNNTKFPKLVWCPYIPDQDETMDSDREDIHMLAVVQGTTIDIFFLQAIKSSLNKSEVRYEQLTSNEVSGAYLSITLDSEITSVRLSPDATAVAVATIDGNISFYVVEADKTRFANSVAPLPNHYAEELLFLDNLNIQNQEQFWKFVVISSDSGRRLSVFDCDNWGCLGKLRFESPNQINRLELLADPTSQFLFVADYDASNLYCLELRNVSTMPCFASCTLVSFCNPMLCVVPCGLAESMDCDLSLEEDDSTPNSILAAFVAITPRSLLELSIDLERCPESDTWSAVRSHADMEEQQQQVEDILRISTCGSYSGGIALPKSTDKSNSTHSNNANINASNSTKALEHLTNKVMTLMEEKMNAMSEKIEALSGEVDKLQRENRNLRNEQNDNLSNVLEKISNELKLRDERIESAMRTICAASQDKLFRSIETMVNQNTLHMQSVVELSQNTSVDTTRNVINQLLVPAIENVCQQLFQQLNERFRDGLQEFVDQLRIISRAQQQQFQQASAASTPLLFQQHNSALIQLIESAQFIQAFELAISFKDPSSITFVCNKVDPDIFFSSPAPVPAHVLLALLHYLSNKLDADAPLKFRYIENLLMYLDNDNIHHHPRDKFRTALEYVSDALNVFMTQDSSAAHKRQVKLLNTLVTNLLRYKYK
ncbi:WD40 region of ge1, enhancer of mRNA-decapping protein domain-containing protein [Ditylenchus destructor]|uniref:WD40 region of ge1, enhancer of mRNA-decapping protein domain-containing protein n=1 Tax=Ditylenchus destructor TaxID=166010 RepID=A0AAD4N4D5_9BILA|nr:WD40 region of ge1, enhancer of mRNA-decapping protein domain-containing protein [Ditylenchus destructor]